MKIEKIKSQLKLVFNYSEYYYYFNNSVAIGEDSRQIKSFKDNITNVGKWTYITMWKERWFLSCNAKDIGTLYLMFALFSGLLGTAFSVLIRLELSGPGVQYIADNQLYNSIITAHAILMIFFMVFYYLKNKNLNWSSKIVIFYLHFTIS